MLLSSRRFITILAVAWTTTTSYLTAQTPSSVILPGKATVVSATMEHDVVLTFTAVAEQNVSLILADSTYPASCSRCVTLGVSVLKPDGGVVGWTGLSDGQQGRFLDAVRLPVSGSYRIVFHSQSPSSASVTATLYLFAQKTAVIPTDSPIQIGNTFPGQDIRLSFEGQVNQAAIIVVDNSTFGNCDGCNSLVARVISPSGAPIGWTRLSGSDTSVTSPAMKLPLTGEYTIVIDPQGERVGSARAVLTLQ